MQTRQRYVLFQSMQAGSVALPLQLTLWLFAWMRKNAVGPAAGLQSWMRGATIRDVTPWTADTCFSDSSLGLDRLPTAGL